MIFFHILLDCFGRFFWSELLDHIILKTDRFWSRFSFFLQNNSGHPEVAFYRYSISTLFCRAGISGGSQEAASQKDFVLAERFGRFSPRYMSRFHRNKAGVRKEFQIDSNLAEKRIICLQVFTVVLTIKKPRFMQVFSNTRPSFPPLKRKLYFLSVNSKKRKIPAILSAK